MISEPAFMVNLAINVSPTPWVSVVMVTSKEQEKASYMIYYQQEKYWPSK